MSTLSELLQQREALAAQQAALEQALRQAQAAERQGAIDKIRALMADHGLTVADLADAPARGRRRKADDGAAPRAGKPVAAKFRNAATGETWSGRGLKPKWLSAALAEGRSLEDFRIAAE